MNRKSPVALILCGGMATRLGKLCEKTPKSLLVIDGRTIIDIIIDRLKSQQITKIILCAGHLHHQLLEKFEGSSDIQVVIEKQPLGTGGAIKNAFKYIVEDLFYVVNGDTLSNINYTEMLKHHLKVGKKATISITKKTKRFDSNNIRIEGDLVKEFLKNMEFEESIEGLYENAGTYLFSRESISMDLYPQVFSLEETILPNLAMNNNLSYWLLDKAVLDIGTVERLNHAKIHWRE